MRKALSIAILLALLGVAATAVHVGGVELKLPNVTKLSFGNEPCIGPIQISIGQIPIWYVPEICL